MCAGINVGCVLVAVTVDVLATYEYAQQHTAQLHDLDVLT
jgi:hypothetical protein